MRSASSQDEKNGARDWRLKFLRARCAYLEDKIRKGGAAPIRHLIPEDTDAAILSLIDYIKSLELQYKSIKSRLRLF